VIKIFASHDCKRGTVGRNQWERRGEEEKVIDGDEYDQSTLYKCMKIT
jgi:hypothetical protein